MGQTRTAAPHQDHQSPCDPPLRRGSWPQLWVTPAALRRVAWEAKRDIILLDVFCFHCALSRRRRGSRRNKQPSPVPVRLTVRHPNLDTGGICSFLCKQGPLSLTPTRKERKNAKAVQHFLTTFKGIYHARFRLLFSQQSHLLTVAAFPGWEATVKKGAMLNKTDKAHMSRLQRPHFNSSFPIFCRNSATCR